MKEKRPMISVIVPVYNVEEYLGRCLDSIVGQTYDNFEIILVDDGSTDSSGKICDRYAKSDDRIKVVHRKNGGLSAARNSGIEVVDGEYITFIDSDDYVARDYLEVLFETIRDNNAEISAVKQYVEYPNRTMDTGTGKKYVLSSEQVFEKMLYGEDFDVSAWGKLYRRSLFEEVRFPEGQLFEDSATTYLLIGQCKRIAMKSIPLYYYVMRSDSITNKSFSVKKFDLIKSTKAMTDYIVKKYPGLEAACERRLMYAYLSTLSQLAKAKSPSKEYINRLMPYIKKHREIVLKDSRTPRRDRVALYFTKFGFRGFCFAWNFYSVLTGRRG